MPIGLLKDIIDRKPKSGALLGLDIGEKTIGLALSDPDQRMALPRETVQRVKFTKDIEVLRKVIKDFEIVGYVLGFPVNMDGTEGTRCESVKHFADEMKNNPKIFGVDPWIALWDERLSTVAVDRFLINSVDMSRRRRDEVVDKLAAQHILQGALDFISSRRSA